MQPTKNAMTLKPVTLNPDDTILTAYAVMRQKSIRHIPVTDQLGKVVGILSDRDVQRAMNVVKRSPSIQEISLDPNLRVEDFMSWPVYAVTSDTTLKKVAEEMLAQKVSAFLVEDNLHRLVGIITTDDLLKIFIQGPQHKDSALRSITEYFTGPELY